MPPCCCCGTRPALRRELRHPVPSPVIALHPASSLSRRLDCGESGVNITSSGGPLGCLSRACHSVRFVSHWRVPNSTTGARVYVSCGLLKAWVWRPGARMTTAHDTVSTMPGRFATCRRTSGCASPLAERSIYIHARRCSRFNGERQVGGSVIECDSTSGFIRPVVDLSPLATMHNFSMRSFYAAKSFLFPQLPEPTN